MTVLANIVLAGYVIYEAKDMDTVGAYFIRTIAMISGNTVRIKYNAYENEKTIVRALYI